MGNEPVAWMIDTLDGKHLMLYGSNPPPVFDSKVNAIPLYTNSSNKVIYLSKAEIESGLSRVKWAELLIKQLPEEHEGRNSWLLNYGSEK